MQTVKKEYISSVEVDYCGIPTHIVFVRNRNSNKKREWLDILTTDINNSEEEVIRIYGLRWDIGVSKIGCRDPVGERPTEVKGQSIAA